MAVTNRVFANTYTFFDATLLTGAFQICDPGLLQPCFLLKIINTSDVNIIISYDGVHGNDVVLAADIQAGTYGEIVLPFQENSRSSGKVALMGRGTRIWVAKEVNAGNSGYLYVISYYQPVTGP